VRRNASPILVLTILAGCSSGPSVSNTGYVGAWENGNERVISRIVIARDGDEYRFSWSVDSGDDRWTVQCDWTGHCDEFVDGEKTSEYTFRAWIDPTSGHLRVECRGKVSHPKEVDVHYVDELVVADDGLTLESYEIERNGKPLESEKRRVFTKVADETGFRAPAS